MNYSIIIPHLNSSKLLKRLLDSIPQNDHFQIIVVDDGSVEDEYASVKALQQNYFFELYGNEGKTAGGARNTGLKHALGRWVLFADADDYYEPGLETAIGKYVNSDYDIVFFDVISRYSDSGKIGFRSGHVNQLIQRVKGGDSFDYLRCCFTSPWSKLIRRSLIEEHLIRFEETIVGNDMMFSVRSGLSAKNVTFDEHQLYCITIGGGSLTNVFNKERFEARLNVLVRLNNYLRSQGKSKYQASVLRYIAEAPRYGFSFCLRMWWLCIKNKSNPFIGLEKILKIPKLIKEEKIRKQLTDDKVNKHYA